MGLAFNLETTPNPNLTEGLSKYFVKLTQEVQNWNQSQLLFILEEQISLFRK